MRKIAHKTHCNKLIFTMFLFFIVAWVPHKLTCSSLLLKIWILFSLLGILTLLSVFQKYGWNFYQILFQLFVCRKHIMMEQYNSNNNNSVIQRISRKAKTNKNNLKNRHKLQHKVKRYKMIFLKNPRNIAIYNIIKQHKINVQQ